jgi:hypothetical protein
MDHVWRLDRNEWFLALVAQHETGQVRLQSRVELSSQEQRLK